MRFLNKQINLRSLGSWCVKGTEESTLEVDFSVPLMHHDPKDFRLICLEKKRKIHFRILSDLKIQSWISLTPSLLTWGFPHERSLHIFLLIVVVVGYDWNAVVKIYLYSVLKSLPNEAGSQKYQNSILLSKVKKSCFLTWSQRYS